MTDEELKKLLSWRVKRGYKGLNLRPDMKAWVVNFDKGETRTSRNFSFNRNDYMSILWYLDEACCFVEKLSVKNQMKVKMFGESKISRLRQTMRHGNDMEGVFLESHSGGTFRLQVCLHMQGRFKLHIPKSITNEETISWCLAFGRQLRALSFDVNSKDLSEEDIKVIWKEFLSLVKEKKMPYSLKFMRAGE